MSNRRVPSSVASILSYRSGEVLEEYLDLPYNLVITLDDEGGYGVEVVDLPGCITYSEHSKDIPGLVREAMLSWIGSALKHNEPVPVPVSIQI